MEIQPRYRNYFHQNYEKIFWFWPGGDDGIASDCEDFLMMDSFTRFRPISYKMTSLKNILEDMAPDLISIELKKRDNNDKQREESKYELQSGLLSSDDGYFSSSSSISRLRLSKSKLNNTPVYDKIKVHKHLMGCSPFITATKCN